MATNSNHESTLGSPTYGKIPVLGAMAAGIMLVAMSVVGGVGVVNAVIDGPSMVVTEDVIQTPSQEPSQDVMQTPSQVPSQDEENVDETRDGAKSSSSSDHDSDLRKENTHEMGEATEPSSFPDHDSDPNEEGRDTPTDDIIHQVEPGDTLSALSSKYGISVDQLAMYNDIVDVNLIYRDSALRVPYMLIPQVDPTTGKIVDPQE